jgi:hypothetical protein
MAEDRREQFFALVGASSAAQSVCRISFGCDFGETFGYACAILPSGSIM